ncbi:MAG TPA: hypothetical protein VFB62_08275 [Polyangiaceae bacterium]|nr:hypothetical protein [Polyangiaceae bacterium]
MHAHSFDEAELFAAIAQSGARALLIGRRAMIVRGLPVLTADYDLWLHIDDIERLNAALEPLELQPNHSSDEARRLGRYVLENDERIDVFVARSQSTKDGERVGFDDVWARRELMVYAEGVRIAIPTLDDLILTKRWAMREKDVADIRLLESLKRSGGS